MEVKVNALCVRATDYKDNDRILTLCTIEKGKLSAGIKGCKSPKSKLRFAASPLCFGEYLLAEKGGRYTVTGCNQIDGFYDIVCDLDKYYAAFAVLEVAERLTGEDAAACAEITLAALDTLRRICYLGESPAVAVLKFVLECLRLSGYGTGAADALKEECAAYCYDFAEGGLHPLTGRAGHGVCVSADALRAVVFTEEGRSVSQFGADAIKEALFFAGRVLEGTCGVSLKNLGQFVQILC